MMDVLERYTCEKCERIFNKKFNEILLGVSNKLRLYFIKQLKSCDDKM
jgi:hypothetical protein